MKIYEGHIELSDRRVIWDLRNDNLSGNAWEAIYNSLVDCAFWEFFELYGVPFNLLGRSGRHVCVEDTPKNRQNYCRMVKTIKRQQREIVSKFNSIR